MKKALLSVLSLSVCVGLACVASTNLGASPWGVGMAAFAVITWYLVGLLTPRAWRVAVATLCVASIFGVSSIAQAASTAPPAIGGDGFGGALLGSVLPYLLTAAGTGLVAALGYGARYLRARLNFVKQERLRVALNILSDFVFEKVTELAQVSITKLKAASEDGKLTGPEAAAAAATAAREVWAHLPADLRELLTKLAGSEAAAVAAYVTPRVESTVSRVRNYPLSPKAPTAAELAAARARIGLRVA